ncbi:hypothetical protein [Paenibacillus sp. SYP-B4298]|nr:hypothetical protein [Paenibacillus sp. SYP-B4298]
MAKNKNVKANENNNQYNAEFAEEMNQQQNLNNKAANNNAATENANK